MFSIPVAEAFDAVDAALEALGALDWDGLPIRERLESLDRLETVRRRAAARSLNLLGSVHRSGHQALGGATAKIIADVIRISPADARRRIRDAEQLQPRTTLTGEVLGPSLPATAAAWLPRAKVASSPILSKNITQRTTPRALAGRPAATMVRNNKPAATSWRATRKRPARV
jgi:hypothetical protein